MKKTSNEWCIEIDEKFGKFAITSVEGWATGDFYYSFYQEKITKNQFASRCIDSTIKATDECKKWLFEREPVT